jgi:hypothetical protein
MHLPRTAGITLLARVPRFCPHHSSLQTRRIYQTVPTFTRLSAASPRLSSGRPNILSTLLSHRPQVAATMATPTDQTQVRKHAGHAHNHDNTYLTSANKNDAGVRITRIGLYVNFGMAIAKGVGGYAFNSKALFADAIHSLTDLVSDVMTLLSVSWALRPPSERFPTGYGKVESLGSLGVSGVLLVGGALMGWAAILQLAQQFIPGFAELADTLGLMAGAHHGHDHSHTDLGPDLNAAWLAGGSILIKEWLYHASTCQLLSGQSSVLTQ